MKLTKILMCALAAGAMAFVCGKAQAVVIGGNLYVPINIKATVSYEKSSDKIATATITTKTILSYWDCPKGDMLAVGPNNHVYLISKTAVISDETVGGYLYLNTDDYIEVGKGNPTIGYKYTDEGTVAVDFYSDGYIGIDFQENDYAFELTGTYTYTESGSAIKSGYYNQSSKFSTSNLGGYGYDWYVDTSNDLPVSGSASGNASGKVVP